LKPYATVRFYDWKIFDPLKFPPEPVDGSFFGYVNNLQFKTVSFTQPLHNFNLCLLVFWQNIIVYLLEFRLKPSVFRNFIGSGGSWFDGIQFFNQGLTDQNLIASHVNGYFCLHNNPQVKKSLILPKNILDEE